MLEDQLSVSLPPLSDHKLLSVAYHDGRGISPLHVSVLKSIADVLDLDPTKTHLNLADYVSIQSLDSFGERISDDEHNSSMFCSVGFHYDAFDKKLLVLALSDGTINVFERTS